MAPPPAASVVAQSVAGGLKLSLRDISVAFRGRGGREIAAVARLSLLDKVGVRLDA